MSTLAPDRPLLNVREAAARLRVSEKTVRRLIGARILPALRIGGSIRVDPGELQAWLYGAVSDDRHMRAPEASRAAGPAGEAHDIRSVEGDADPVSSAEAKQVDTCRFASAAAVPAASSSQS
jgi:excisionase family DNA binding protein